MRRNGSSFTAIATLATSAVFALGVILAAGTAQASFSAATVYRAAAPSVVVIYAFDSPEKGSSGTGSLVTADGMILTNNHVVENAATGKTYKSIRVFFKPDHITGDVSVDLKESFPVRVVARDKVLDLAVIQVQGAPRHIPVMRLGDSERVDVGSSVAAIGHPGGGGLWTLTTGTISSRRRDDQRDVFQTDAAINPGNSGGPLLDGNAHLIGVNTFVRRVNSQGLPLEGLNYSIRSGLVRQWLGEQGVRVAFSTSVQQQGAPAAPPPAPQQTQPQTSPPVAPPPHPEPDLRIDPEPQAKPREPAPAAKAEEPRKFKGPNGEEMYGVPQRNFSLMGAAAEVYDAAFKNANEAFDELDAEFE
jgi:V8-like Glu-specific endopeptidase